MKGKQGAKLVPISLWHPENIVDLSPHQFGTSFITDWDNWWCNNLKGYELVERPKVYEIGYGNLYAHIFNFTLINLGYLYKIKKFK